jgi:hypothetical protein
MRLTGTTTAKSTPLEYITVYVLEYYVVLEQQVKLPPPRDQTDTTQPG